MSKTINILVAANAEKLAQQVEDKKLSPGTKDNPTNLGSYQQSDVFISMLTQSQYTSNQGSSELTVRANSGDNIRWTMATFDAGSDYSAFIYKSAFSKPKVDDVFYQNLQVRNYIPSSTEPLMEYNEHIYICQGTVDSETADTVQYTMSFAVIDNSNGQYVGYFMWDPFISINK